MHAEERTKEQLSDELLAHRQDIPEITKKKVPRWEAEAQYLAFLMELVDNPMVALQHGQKVYQNPAYDTLLGYTMEESPERSFLEDIVPDDRQGFQDYDHKRRQGEEVPVPYHITLMTWDGQRVLVQLKSYIISYQGKPVILAVLHRIATCKRTAQTPQENEVPSRELIEGAMQGISIVNKDARYVFANQGLATILGYNAMQGDRERCLAAGMDDYVSKPARSEALAGILQKWTPSPADDLVPDTG